MQSNKNASDCDSERFFLSVKGLDSLSKKLEKRGILR